jgi:hypothetical protein
MKRLLAAAVAAAALLTAATPPSAPVQTRVEYLWVSCGGACTTDPVLIWHWGYRVVYIEDHSSLVWPVHAAQYQWQWGTDVDVRYGGCRAGAGCVRVYDGYYGATWAGKTPMTYSGDRILSARIALNDSIRLDAHQHRQAACHELGHALGLEYHHRNYASCMHWQVSDAASMYPTWWDRHNLNLVD